MKEFDILTDIYAGRAKYCLTLVKCSPKQEHTLVYSQGSAAIYREADHIFTSFFCFLIYRWNCVRSLSKFTFFDEAVGEEDQVLPLPSKNTKIQGLVTDFLLWCKIATMSLIC